MSDRRANTRVRTNVVARGRSDAEFRAALSWPELRLYLELFWPLIRSEVLSGLTEKQRWDRERLHVARERQGDPFRAVVEAHRRLLLVEDDSNIGETAVSAAGTPVNVDVTVDYCESEAKSATPSVDPQTEVIEEPWDCKILVLAPPGTGKTEVVTRRLVRLAGTELSGDLSGVCAVTFSRAAAMELGRRLLRPSSGDDSPVYLAPRLSTLDSLAGTITSAVGDFRANGYDQNVRLFARMLEGRQGPDVRRAARDHLRQRVRLIVIDEIQDIVGVRARLVRAMLDALDPADHGLMVLGDTRQAIYDFALRDVERYEKQMDCFWLIDQIRAMYPGLRETTFSTRHRYLDPTCEKHVQSIQEAMDDPTGRCLPGARPDVRSLRKQLGRLRKLAHPEALASMNGTVAVLAQTNKQVRQLYSACVRATKDLGCSVQLARSPAPREYAHPEWIARTLISPDGDIAGDRASVEAAYRRRVRDDLDEASRRVVWLWALCGRGEDPITAERVSAALTDDTAEPFDLRARPIREGSVWVSTVHQAKGREFDHVVIFKAHSIPKDSESARVAYVAATRARRRLYTCSGAVWSPRLLGWSFKYIDVDSLARRAVQTNAAEWHHMQDMLWELHVNAPSRMTLYQWSEGRYVLEPEGAESGFMHTIPLVDSFASKFEAYAMRILRSTDPSRRRYSAQVLGVRTVRTGHSTRPLMLIPDLSGEVHEVKE